MRIFILLLRKQCFFGTFTREEGPTISDPIIVESATILIFVGMLVFLAHLFSALFEKTRIPDVLNLIIIGIILGPVLHIVSTEDFGKVGPVFTTIALVVILFEGGLELSIEPLRKSWRSALVLTLVSYLAGWIAVTATILWLVDIPYSLALFMGAVLAGSAPAIVIPFVRHLTLSSTSRTALTLEAPLGEALSIVVGLAILDSIRLETLHVGLWMGRLVSSFVFAFVIGSAGGFLWSVLLHRIRQLRYAIFTTPSFILVLFGVTEFLGFSGSVAALSFGFALGNLGTRKFQRLTGKYNLTPLQHNETEKAFFGEIVFIIKTFFFVYLGLSVRLTDAWTLTLAGILTCVLLIMRLLSVRASTPRDGTTVRDGLLMGVMIPKGTAVAVLAAIPLQMGITSGEQIQTILYTAVVASIVITGVMVFLLERTPLPRALGIIFAGYSSGTTGEG
jgi:cell volume regulation protein A